MVHLRLWIGLRIHRRSVENQAVINERKLANLTHLLADRLSVGAAVTGEIEIAGRTVERTAPKREPHRSLQSRFRV